VQFIGETTRSYTVGVDMRSMRAINVSGLYSIGPVEGGWYRLTLAGLRTTKDSGLCACSSFRATAIRRIAATSFSAEASSGCVRRVLAPRSPRRSK